MHELDSIQLVYVKRKEKKKKALFNVCLASDLTKPKKHAKFRYFPQSKWKTSCQDTLNGTALMNNFLD